MFDVFFNDEAGPAVTGSSGARLPADELALYLSSGVEHLQGDGLGRPGDPLKWWWDHRDTYPQLQAMATDYLSIPCKG